MFRGLLKNALPKSLGQIILATFISSLAIIGLVISLTVHAVIMEYKDKIVVCSMIVDNTTKE